MNKRVLYLGVLLVVLVIGIFCWLECFYADVGSEDLDCVPASCCHADSCVWEDEAPDCEGMLCTMDCAGGTMDCGAGHCEVVDGNCEVVWDE